MSSIGEDFTESIGTQRRYEHLNSALFVKKAVNQLTAFLLPRFRYHGAP